MNDSPSRFRFATIAVLGAVVGFVNGLAVGAWLWTAPPAHADTRGEQNFLRDMNALGIVSDTGPQGFLNGGYLVCSELRAGLTPEAIAEQYWHNSLTGQGLALAITFQQAEGIVVAAEVDLCSGGGTFA